MARREFATQKKFQDYAERTGQGYLWEGTPPFAKRQRVLSPDQMFLNNLYGGIDEPGTKIIDVFICKLRKKLLKASNGKDYIETVWGRGWMLHEPSEGSSFEMVVQQAFESPSMLNCVG
jgi:hypothetical protein